MVSELKDEKWIDVKDKPISKSGFYKIMNKNGHIHYVKYVKPGCFMTGIGKDYRNGGRYPCLRPIKYIYLFGLNDKWEPDPNIKEKYWPEGI